MKMTITPEIAKELLKKNKKNRRLNMDHVRRLSKEIKKGKWSYTGDSIKVSKEDLLIDGQHRLHAVIHSGCSIQIELVVDVDEDSFGKVDTGLNRQASQVLQMEGIKNAKSVAAIVRGLLGIQAQGGLSKSFVVRKGKIPNDEVMEATLKVITELEQSQLIPKCKVEGLPSSVQVILAYLYLNGDKDLVLLFINHLTDGLFQSKTDPCKKLRDKVVESRGKRAGGNTPPIELMAVTVKAWNAFYDNKELRSLGFAINEHFPIPKGVAG